MKHINKPIFEDFLIDDGDPRGISTSDIRNAEKEFRKALREWESENK